MRNDMDEMWKLTEGFFKHQIALDRERINKPKRVAVVEFETKEELAADTIRIEAERHLIDPLIAEEIAARSVEQMKRGGLF